MRAIRLRTEYLSEPIGLGIARPRLSWNCEDGVTQTAYRIVARRRGAIVWDTGEVASSRMRHIRYDGEELRSRDRVEWTVTLWDESRAPGAPAASWFELGLLAADDWTAGWISGDYAPRRNRRYPVDHFRHPFAARSEVARARLHITACGLYEAELNGQPVGRGRLTPGSTDYRTRIQYQSYDVTGLLAAENALTVRVADGWFRGSIGCFGPTNVFGRRTALLYQLEIDYVDGSRDTVRSGEGVRWSADGPIRFADLKDGEVVDARLTPDYGGIARVVAGPGVSPTASDNVAPEEHERFVPTLITTPSGERVLDFGQNIAGFVGFEIAARAGQRIRLRMGEILDDAGEFTQHNMQARKPAREFGRAAELLLMTGKPDLIPGKLQPTPKQEVDYICADGVNRYRTTFAVFGFRYALVETELDIDPADFHAIAVYSAMEQTGDFICSNPDLNQLLANTRWSMKGNFLDVPTDCPTRERLGWTAG